MEIVYLDLKVTLLQSVVGKLVTSKSDSVVVEVEVASFIGLSTPAPHSVGSSDQCQGRRLTNRVLRRINLLERLKRPEGKPLEFKPDLPSPDGALKPIVAFPNTAGDILRIGVDDRSRNVRSVADPLDEEERLAHQGFDLKLGLPSQWASMASCWRKADFSTCPEASCRRLQPEQSTVHTDRRVGLHSGEPAEILCGDFRDGTLSPGHISHR